MANDLEGSLESVIELGFARILTSGQSKCALDGIKEIRKLVSLAGDRIIIMPGSGVNADNLSMILKESNAKEFHSSASALRDSSMVYRNPRINMGENSSEFSLKVAVAAKVGKLIEISNKL